MTRDEFLQELLLEIVDKQSRKLTAVRQGDVVYEYSTICIQQRLAQDADMRQPEGVGYAEYPQYQAFDRMPTGTVTPEMLIDNDTIRLNYLDATDAFLGMPHGMARGKRLKEHCYAFQKMSKYETDIQSPYFVAIHPAPMHGLLEKNKLKAFKPMLTFSSKKQMPLLVLRGEYSMMLICMSFVQLDKLEELKYNGKPYVFEQISGNKCYANEMKEVIMKEATITLPGGKLPSAPIIPASKLPALGGVVKPKPAPSVPAEPAPASVRVTEPDEPVVAPEAVSEPVTPIAAEPAKRPPRKKPAPAPVDTLESAGNALLDATIKLAERYEGINSLSMDDVAVTMRTLSELSRATARLQEAATNRMYSDLAELRSTLAILKGKL